MFKHFKIFAHYIKVSKQLLKLWFKLSTSVKSSQNTCMDWLELNLIFFYINPFFSFHNMIIYWLVAATKSIYFSNLSSEVNLIVRNFVRVLVDWLFPVIVLENSCDTNSVLLDCWNYFLLRDENYYQLSLFLHPNSTWF